MKILTCLASLVLLSAAANAHEITYEGKICECLGDVDDDGDVDRDDVDAVLDSFYAICDDATGCIEDLNHNHRVGDGDLRVLLGRWGDCPLEADVDRDKDRDVDDALAILGDLGLDCRGDLDWNGTIEENDVEIAEDTWGLSPDYHPVSLVLDDEPGLALQDLLALYEALGRDCRADVDRNGTVECNDFDELCLLTPGACNGLTCP